MHLGGVLRRARTAQDLSQWEVARRARISKPYLSQLETGVRRNPSLPTLRRLAKALRVPVTELLQ